MTSWGIAVILAYLTGAIPFGVFIGWSRGIDIRSHGSKNIGATNVGRVLGRGLGVLCFVLDFLKGAAPVIAAGLWHQTLGRDAHLLTASQMWGWLAVMLATVLGHMFPVYLGFRGGKGVATTFGAMVAMYPLLTFAALGAIAVWYVSLRLFKYVSLASILAAASLPVGCLLSVLPRQAFDQPLADTMDGLSHASPPLIITAVLAGLVIYRHRANIGRLRRGEEPRVDGAARRGSLTSNT